MHSRMLTLLADETRERHGAADGDRLSLMERPNALRYRTFLVQVYRFEAPIERALAATPGYDRGLLHTHLKTRRLELDLDALGVRELAPLAAIPRFGSAEEALGWAYVIQRNTLLHGLVSRYLADKLPHEIQVGGTYLAAFEGCVGARLGELGIVLDRAARRDSIAQRIVDAANDAFHCQRQWYSAPHAVPAVCGGVTEDGLARIRATAS